MFNRLLNALDAFKEDPLIAAAIAKSQAEVGVEVVIPAPPPLDETHDFGHYKSISANIWRWENFSPAELKSRGNGHVVLHIPTLDLLQAARTAWGKSLTINSAYRDPAYNAKVGGAPMSQHKLGRAFDISVRGMSAQEKAELVKHMYNMGFTGFGGYNTFLHVDTGRARVWGQEWAWPNKVVI